MASMSFCGQMSTTRGASAHCQGQLARILTQLALFRILHELNAAVHHKFQQQIKALQDPTGFVDSLEFHPDGLKIVLGQVQDVLLLLFVTVHPPTMCP